MSSAWVEKYMDSWNSSETIDEIGTHEMEIIAKGSHHLIESLWKQVKNDLDDFHARGGDPRLVGSFIPSSGFRVRRSDYPAIHFEVFLEAPFIKCFRNFKRDHESILVESGVVELGIRADAHGRLQVKQNGAAFIDGAELSNFLLEPALKLIRNNP